MPMPSEPRIWSHITDVPPDDHPLAWRTLVAWLRAQLDDDERVAQAAVPAPGWAPDAGTGRWKATVSDFEGGVSDEDGATIVYDEGSPTNDQSEHIARHDPARVLAEVEAKRRILDEHPAIPKPYRLSGRCERCYSHDDEVAGDRPVTHPCPTIRLLALPYADRPGYRDEWKP